MVARVGYIKQAGVVDQVQQLQTAHQEARTFNYELAQVQDQERENLAYVLHDGVLQNLIFIARHATFCLELFQHEQAPSANVASQMQNLSLVAQDCIQEVRNICLGLYPIAVDTVGLAAALHWLGEDTSRCKAPDFEVKVKLAGLHFEERLPRLVEHSLFMVARECLNNTIKHAQASQVTIQLDCTQPDLIFEIHDDGKGLPVAFSLAQFTREGHLGLAGLRIRVERLGGQFEIISRPGQGTLVRVRLTCAKLPSVDSLADRPANSPKARTVAEARTLNLQT